VKAPANSGLKQSPNCEPEKAYRLMHNGSMPSSLRSLVAIGTVLVLVSLGTSACSSDTQVGSSLDGGRGAGGANGGMTSAGGTANGGSTSGSGGSGAGGACAPVSIHMNRGGPPPGTDFCSGPPNCDSGDPFTVLDASGKALTTWLSCGMADCTSCVGQPCPPGSCHFSSPVPAAGTDFTWDGTVYADSSGCGSGQIGSPPVRCWKPSCAPPGRYTAHLCAYALPPNSDGGVQVCELHAATTPTCVDVPFDYPTTTQVVGALDPRK
jgi:hypothetical protein